MDAELPMDAGILVSTEAEGEQLTGTVTVAWIPYKVTEGNKIMVTRQPFLSVSVTEL
jgi:hypothetical protein